jgi:hypothetical protein
MTTKLSTERARDAWPYLVERASANGDPFTYKQLSPLMGLHWRAAQCFLDVICVYCEKKGRPWLTALVVNQTTRLPGPGRTNWGKTKDDFRVALQKIHTHPWPPQAPF